MVLFMVGRADKALFITLLVMLLYCGMLGCIESKKPVDDTDYANSSGFESDYTNSIGMKFMKIPEGEFMMGSSLDTEGRDSDESPLHKVTIKKPFYMGKFEVTQKQWREVMGSNPSYFEGDNLPVERVSWNDVQVFIKKLNEIEGTNKYHLPSEAEWEYACRAETTTRYSFGDADSELKDYGWYSDYATAEEWQQNFSKIVNEGSTHAVGQKKPNPWRLYDMHGNVWEWCQDTWHDNYDGAPSDGSAWENGNNSSRVCRGGGWANRAWGCLSSNRYMGAPDGRNRILGFRVLKEI